MLSKAKQKVVSLKQDCQLYVSLYVACQNRYGVLADFFSHENHSYPPSLSIYGKMRQTTESDTITILEKIKDSSHSHPYSTAIVFDGAAIVQMVEPNS